MILDSSALVAIALRQEGSDALLERMAAAGNHNGGRIRFGPDGRLYLTMGDAANASLAQSLSSLNGKVLRLDDTGAAAPGNPFGGEIWTWGHRNPQGIDWHPATGDLWETEHGDNGNDEINRLQPGRNYGWPIIEGATSRPDMDRPVEFFSPSIAPSGASFYAAERMPSTTRLSMSRIAEPGSASKSSTSPCRCPICARSSRRAEPRR